MIEKRSNAFASSRKRCASSSSRRAQRMSGMSIASAPSHAAEAARCTKSDATDQNLPASVALWLTIEYVSIAPSPAAISTSSPAARLRLELPRNTRSAPASATTSRIRPAKRYCPVRTVVRYDATPVSVPKRLTASRTRNAEAMKDTGISTCARLITQRSIAPVYLWYGSSSRNEAAGRSPASIMNAEPPTTASESSASHFSATSRLFGRRLPPLVVEPPVVSSDTPSGNEPSALSTMNGYVPCRLWPSTVDTLLHRTKYRPGPSVLTPMDASVGSLSSNAMSPESTRSSFLSRTWICVSLRSMPSLKWRTTRTGGRRRVSLFAGLAVTSEACAYARRAGKSDSMRATASAIAARGSSRVVRLFTAASSPPAPPLLLVYGPRRATASWTLPHEQPPAAESEDHRGADAAQDDVQHVVVAAAVR